MQGPPTPKKPAWEEVKLNPKTTLFLDFTEANPTSVFTLLARASGYTIIKDPAFKNKLTITTGKEVNLKTAFEIVNSVLNFSGYEFHQRNGYLYVERIPPPPQPAFQPPPPQPDIRPIAKTYKIQFASATQVNRVINEVYGGSGGGSSPGGGSPFGMPGMPGMPGAGGGGNPMSAIEQGGPPGTNSPIKTSYDEYSNSIVVYTSPQKQPIIEALIKELDQPADNQLESEVFKLKHVTVEEALPAIKELLISQSPLGRGTRQEQQSNSNFFFFRFGGDSPSSKGSQTAVAVKQTNSIIVNATKANIALIRKLLDSLDVTPTYLSTTSVIQLHNAKASDIASLLSEAFKQRQNRNNDDPFFFFFGDFGNSQNKQATTDLDSQGNIANIRDLSGKVTLVADPNTNSLVVTTVPSNIPLIEAVVAKLDQSPQQVMIETIIVEATLDKTTKLGAEWSLLQPNALGSGKVSGLGTQNFGLKPAAGASPLQGASYTLTADKYSVFLNALVNDQRFKVLSTPRIVTSNNIKSQMNVSQKVPYVVSQQTNGNGVTNFNYEFLDVGVILDVTPRVTDNMKVAMDIKQTANELQGYTSFNAPIVNNRSAEASVWVNDGETAVLGGIIRNTQRVNDVKVPILGDIPILGQLFKNASNQVVQTELLIFLTPHIIKNGDDIRRIRENTQKELSGGLGKRVQEAVEKAQAIKKGGGKS